MVLLVPTVKREYMRSLLLGWGMRLIAGAGRTFMVLASPEQVRMCHKLLPSTICVPHIA